MTRAVVSAKSSKIERDSFSGGIQGDICNENPNPRGWIRRGCLRFPYDVPGNLQANRGRYNQTGYDPLDPFVGFVPLGISMLVLPV